MSFLRRPYSYSMVEKEDPDEQSHRKAQFLIYKAMEEAKNGRRRSSAKVTTLCKSNAGNGRHLKKLRKRTQFTISGSGIGVGDQVMEKMKHLKRMFCGKDGITLSLFG